MQLLQFRISHNCVKVSRSLELKGLPFETVECSPMKRDNLESTSGQPLVPVLDDDGHVVSDSTAILRYLEERYPEKPLLPADPTAQAECWILEDWADAALMALTRRIAYCRILQMPGMIESLFFPDARGLRRRILGMGARKAVRRRFRISESRNRRDEREARRIAAIAVDRLGNRHHLVGDRVTVADITLASMSAPLWSAAPALRDDAAIRRLLEWGETILGTDYAEMYRVGVRL